MGTEGHGTRVGATGTAIFSFHPIKNLTTGEGGMICTDDEKLADQLRRLRFHGLGVDAFDRETQGRAPQAEVIEPGFKYNLPDMNACLGLGQPARLDSLNASHLSLAMHYLERLKDIPKILPLQLPVFPNKHCWHLFVVRLDVDAARLTRDAFMAKFKEHGIGTGLHFRVAHSQKYYRESMPQAGAGLENTQWNSDRILSLPLFPAMTIADVDRVADTIEYILG